MGFEPKKTAAYQLMPADGTTAAVNWRGYGVSRRQLCKSSTLLYRVNGSGITRQVRDHWALDVADVPAASSGGVLSFAAGGVVEAWLSFAASMMTVRVEVPVGPTLSVATALGRSGRKLFGKDGGR
jgi:hypothetical protein